MANNDDFIITDITGTGCCMPSLRRNIKHNDTGKIPSKIVYQKRTTSNCCDLCFTPENAGVLNDQCEFNSFRNATKVCKRIFVAQSLIVQIGREKDEDGKGLSYDAIRKVYNPYYVDIAFKDKNGKVLKSEDLDKKNKENIIEATDDKKNTEEIKFDGKQ